jgi:hypothetical protein
MSKSELLKRAEKEVDDCLNYGGVFHDGSHTTKELELVYEMGDVEDEVAHMRRFSKALSELADAVEAELVG